MATEGRLKGWKGVRKICSSVAFFPEVRVSRVFFLRTEGWVDLYDVCVLYLTWLPELALVIYPFPAILFSYNIYIYICCVVLQVFLLNN